MSDRNLKPYENIKFYGKGKYMEGYKNHYYSFSLYLYFLLTIAFKRYGHINYYKSRLIGT